MTVEWSRVRHFDPSEWQKDPARVDPALVYLVDDLREYVGRPIVIHVAWDDARHAEDSAHYDRPCTAVDLHIKGLNLCDQWLAAERFPFSGIGLYPSWAAPGLHVDIRPNPEHPTVGRRWWRDQVGSYHALNRAFLKTIV